jgi:hypothetical protein
MKRLIFIIAALLLSTIAFADNRATHMEGTETGLDIVPCLDDLPVTYSIEFRYIERESVDGSGGYHFMRNIRWTGTIIANDLSMSWSGQGGGPFVINANGNNNQDMQVLVRHEVQFADGDYPNLLWSLSFSGTTNANGDLTSLRINPGTFRCLSN